MCNCVHEGGQIEKIEIQKNFQEILFKKWKMNELTYLGKEEEISRLREFFQTGYQRLFSEDKKKTDHGFCVRILIYINIFPFHLLVTLKHALCVCVLSHSVMSNSLQLRGL